MFMYSSWMRLPLTTRALLATQFGFSKTGSTHVQDNVVVADGYRIGDIEAALNLAAIQKYVGSTDTDMMVLWQMMVDKIEGRAPVVTHDEPKPIELTTVSLEKKTEDAAPAGVSGIETPTVESLVDTITKTRRTRASKK